jgi:hypothetical protein
MATALPAATDFTGATITEGQYKTAMTNLRAYLSENMGTLGGGQVDAASGTVFRRNILINGSMEVWNDSTASTSCTAGAKTSAAECWYVQPAGAAVTRARSTTVRTGALARYSLEIVGATSVTTVLVGQRLEAADIRSVARQVTFQAWVYNGSGSAFTPTLLLGTPGAADDFTTVTNRLTQALQSCADGSWTQVSHTADISAYTNLANGLQVELQVPSGSLVSGDTVRVAEPQLAAGANVSLFEVEPVPVTQVRCERFFEKSFAPDTAPAQNVGLGTGEHRWASTSTGAVGMQSWVNFRTLKRVAPTVTLYNPAAANAQVRNVTDSADCSSCVGTGYHNQALIGGTANSGATVGEYMAVHWTATARLF